MTYDAHQALIEPARRAPQIWRLAVGLALTGAVYFVLVFGWFAVEMALGRLPGGDGLAGRTPDAALSLLASFLCVYPALALTLRWLHRRKLRSLFGPAPAMWRDARRAGIAAVGIVILNLVLPGPATPEPVANLALDRWVLWVLPGLLGVIVQITAEEVLFRGYLQSQLAARFRSPLIWLVLPAVIFGSLHYSPATAGPNALWLLLPPIGFGLIAGDLTARCGNLGPALMLHFINNAAAILLVAPGDQLSGLALYRFPIDMTDPAIRAQMPVELAMMFVLWLAVRLALRK